MLAVLAGIGYVDSFTSVRRRRRDDRRRRRSAHRARGDHRQAAHRQRRRRRDRRRDPGAHPDAAPAVGDGAHRVRHRHPAVLRGRRRAADPGGHPRRPPVPKLSMIALGIPALAGLSALHGLVPPHPGPLIAIDALGADLGTHARARPAGGHPDRDHRGSAAGQAARAVGACCRRPTRSSARRARTTTRAGPGFGVALMVVLLPGRAHAAADRGRGRGRRREHRSARRSSSSARRWSRC